MSTDANNVIRDPGTPVVLVVEDQILVRMVLADFLRRCGLTVVEASSTAEAITALESEMEIDFVFSAHQTDAFELAQWVRANRPGLPVLVSAGLTRKVADAVTLCEEEGTALPKPYDPAEVERTIRRLLAAKNDKGE